MKHRLTASLQKSGIDIGGIYDSESLAETSGHTTDTATDFHHAERSRCIITQSEQLQVPPHLVVAAGGKRLE
jgi:hypothetical protein